MLVTASSAFGAADPLKGGSTTLGPLKLPKKVKVSATGGATKSGKTVTLPITGGTFDPTNGVGPVQDGGTITLKKGKKKVKLSSIVTTFGALGVGGSITATLSGKKGKKSAKSTTLATIAGGTVGRAGFGGTLTNAVAKLTKKGAKALNNALDRWRFQGRQARHDVDLDGPVDGHGHVGDVRDDRGRQRRAGRLHWHRYLHHLRRQGPGRTGSARLRATAQPSRASRPSSRSPRRPAAASPRTAPAAP